MKTKEKMNKQNVNQPFDKKPVEEKLALYSKAIDEAADGVQITDLEGYIIYSNKAIKDIYGYTPEEYMGRHVNEMNADPEFAEREVLPSILATGRWAGEIWVKHKNGHVFPIWLTTGLVFGDNGAPIAMIGIIRDITQRKKAEEDLRENKEKILEQLGFANALNLIAENVLKHDDTKDILENMARIIGEILGLDRTLIYDVDYEHRMAYGLCEWKNPITPGISSTMNNWNLDMFKNIGNFIMKKRTWFESHIDAVNPIIKKDKVTEILHRKMAAQSILYYPFSFSPKGFYLLIFHQTGYRRIWRPEEFEFFSAAAQLVEIAIQKIRFVQDQQKAELEIWQEKEKAQVTLHSIGDAVITTDAVGMVEYLNPVAEDLTGWTNEEAMGKPLPEVFNIINEVTGVPTENPVARCIKEGRVIGLANHTVLINRDGHQFAIEDSAAPIRDREGKIIGAILVFHDVSEERNLMMQLTHQAYHDPLTGLPNRVLFNDRFSLALAQAKRNKEMMAVLFLDLDRFKLVNDMLGHTEGDKVLKKVADKLQDSIRKTDSIARLGGDEFTILLPQIGNVNDVAKLAQKIIRTFQKPWIVGDQEFHITVSIGIALYPNDGDDTETLLMHADTAMYRAKEQGRNNYQLYTPAMNTKIMERLTLENSLRHALKRKEFTVYYQPQVNVQTGEITGMEALVRWNHPSIGLVAPTEFIQLAEETGLIVPIGDYVLFTACAQNKAWQDAGLPPIRVTVNISACQFTHQNLVDSVAKVLKTTGLDAEWLELEVTESALIKDFDFAIKTLLELRKMGVRISIDDFGIGYSSLNYLKRLPINTLKIDKYFMQDIMNNPEDAAIVSTIIVLAKNLNLKVVSEGVETEQQLDFLKQRECHEMQGFLFSEPLPAGRVEKFLKKKK